MTSLRPPVQPSPFENNHADPWAKAFIDLPSLNAKVTDAISAAIKKVQTDARRGAELHPASLLVLGPAGAGKTHLFGRLRHKLGPRAIFVHLRPLLGTEMTPRYVLGQIVQQLGYETADGKLKQLEALVGSSLAQLEGSNPEFPRIFIDELAGLDEVTRAEKIEGAVEQLLDRHQQADETYLGRLLTAPFMKSAQQRAALAWLGGHELEEAQMKRLGVGSSLPEERIVRALQTLGLFAAPGAPIVLVFDQLENLIDPEGTGSRVRAYANLVAELFDTARGVVLVQMALDSEWQKAILPQLSTAQRTRLGGHSEVIALPTPAQSRELIAKWLEQLPQRAESFPWPFGERRVSIWCDTPGMTPRMLMIACRQALALGHEALAKDDPEVPSSDRSVATADDGADAAALEASWDKHLVGARMALDEAAENRRSADAARLVGGIAGALRFASGTTTTRIDARQYLQLTARVGEHTQALAFLHQSHPRSAITAIERAGDALRSDGVLVVRERAMDLPPGWKKVRAELKSLLDRGARWLSIERDDAALLLALESFLAAAKSRDLEDARGRTFEEREVEAWIEASLRVAEWPIVTAFTGRVGTSVDETERDLPPTSDPRVEVEAGPGAVHETAATIRTCLHQLRIASLERLVREVSRVKPDAKRVDIVAALEQMQQHVRWFGRAIVGVKEDR